VLLAAFVAKVREKAKKAAAAGEAVSEMGGGAGRAE
jgi:hypothetical protein